MATELAKCGSLGHGQQAAHVHRLGPKWTQLYNDGYADIPGKKHPAVMGSSAQVTWREIWPVVAPMWSRVMAGEAVGFDGLRLTVDRHGYPEECVSNFSYSPLRDDDAQVRGVFVSCVETTDRERIEQRLKWKAQRLKELGDEAEAREQQLQAVLDSVSAAVITVDSSFRVTLFNKAAESMFRVSAAQVLGRSINNLLPERYRPGHAAKIASFGAAAGGSQVLGVERELVGRRWDGELSIRRDHAGLGLDGQTRASVSVTAGDLSIRDPQARALDAAGLRTEGHWTRLNMKIARTTALPQQWLATASLKAQTSLLAKIWTAASA